MSWCHLVNFHDDNDDYIDNKIQQKIKKKIKRVDRMGVWSQVYYQVTQKQKKELNEKAISSTTKKLKVVGNLTPAMNQYPMDGWEKPVVNLVCLVNPSIE